MFGFGKTKLLAKMESLTNIAQMAVYMMLTNLFQVDAAQTDGERDVVATKAAAWANYLFGKSPSPQHAHLNPDAEHQDAQSWLKQNRVARELVVQSLRVANTIAYGKTSTAPELGMDLLSSFGAEFPNAPDPASYEALVHRAIALLPPEHQQRLLVWSKTER